MTECRVALSALARRKVVARGLFMWIPCAALHGFAKGHALKRGLWLFFSSIVYSKYVSARRSRREPSVASTRTPTVFSSCLSVRRSFKGGSCDEDYGAWIRTPPVTAWLRLSIFRASAERSSASTIINTLPDLRPGRVGISSPVMTCA